MIGCRMQYCDRAVINCGDELEEQANEGGDKVETEEGFWCSVGGFVSNFKKSGNLKLGSTRM